MSGCNSVFLIFSATGKIQSVSNKYIFNQQKSHILSGLCETMCGCNSVFLIFSATGKIPSVSDKYNFTQQKCLILSGWCETVCGEQDKRGNSGEEWQVCWPELLIIWGTTTDVMIKGIIGDEVVQYGIVWGRMGGHSVQYGGILPMVCHVIS